MRFIGMGMYNTFKIHGRCPTCSAESLFELQARIGDLNCFDFNVGDLVFDPSSKQMSPRLAPDKDIIKNKTNFWAMGAEQCSQCESMIWAKIFVAKGVFTRIELIDEDPYDPKSSHGPFDWAVTAIAMSPTCCG